MYCTKIVEAYKDTNSHASSDGWNRASADVACQTAACGEGAEDKSCVRGGCLVRLSVRCTIAICNTWVNVDVNAGISCRGKLDIAALSHYVCNHIPFSLCTILQF